MVGLGTRLGNIHDASSKGQYILSTALLNIRIVHERDRRSKLQISENAVGYIDR